MASSFSSEYKGEFVSSFMTCSFCQKQLLKSKMMPCKHLIGPDCLQDMLEKNNSVFTCPKCNLVLHIKKEDIEDIPEDYLFKALVDNRDKYKNSNCVCCEFQGEITPGVYKCIDCGDVLCQCCSAGHTMSSITVNHRVVPLSDVKEGKYRCQLQSPRLICESHSRRHKPMYLDLYCDTCKAFACQMCAIINHQPKGHVCQAVDDVFDVKYSQLSDQLSTLSHAQNWIQEYFTFLEQSHDSTRSDTVSIQKEIIKRADKLIQAIDAIKNEKLEEVKKYHQEGGGSLENRLAEAKNQMIRNETLMQYSEAFMKYSNRNDFCRYEGDLNSQISEYKAKRFPNDIIIPDLKMSDFLFEKCKKHLEEAFGNVVVRRKKRIAYCHRKTVDGSLSDITNTNDLIHEHQSNYTLMSDSDIIFNIDSGIGNACGMTMSDKGEIIAVGGFKIQKFDLIGQHVKTMECWELTHAYDVAIYENHLYISDQGYEDPKVLILTMEGTIKKTIHMPRTLYHHGGMGLAIDRTGCLFVTSEHEHAIYKCKQNGSDLVPFVKREKQGEKRYLLGPIYICMTAGGGILVSNIQGHNIQMYNHKGEALWRYSGEEDMKLSQPYGVTSDRNGYIYVADHTHNCIQILAHGRLKDVINPMPQFKKPCALVVDGDSNIICSYNWGTNIVRVKVWQTRESKI